MLTSTEQRNAAKKFAENWKDRGNEEQDAQSFWLTFLHSVFQISEPATFIEFEKKVNCGDTTCFIDAYIPQTRILIEQKSRSKDLRTPFKQSDGVFRTPYEQGKHYADNLPVSQHPRYIVTCNFGAFHIHDMEAPNEEPEEILLANLEKEYYRLEFLVDSEVTHIKKEMEISFKAGEMVGKLYDAIHACYKDQHSAETLKNLNKLCVRLVFCLYAEDAGIFPQRNQFSNYLGVLDPRDLHDALVNLFKVLNTKEEERETYLNPKLEGFPYVDGGLFQDYVEIPQLNKDVQNFLVADAGDGFDWSGISPTIFGAIFESTLNPETRRSGGMHYTSIENIHRVINPLFLDDLKHEFRQIQSISSTVLRNKKLIAFQDKIGKLSFLDPACGSGNFLTETYLSLRRMENEILRTLNEEQIVFDLGDEIKVSIQQFYGIEINDFAVSVARTALWIAENQMVNETNRIVHRRISILPLKTYPNIVEGNALQIDWESVVSKEKLTYIMGNPPFVGKKEQSRAQKKELLSLFDFPLKGVGNLDYVTGWYVKALDYIQKTNIHVAFVSTNSITQGEQCAIFWQPMIEQKSLCIDFAWRTFCWNSESNLKAHVHCVIIGFHRLMARTQPPQDFFIFTEDGQRHSAQNINAYLADAPNVFILPRAKCLCDVPAIMYGSMPIDDGNLILTKQDVDELIKENPSHASLIRPYAGGVELIRNRKRWCLWLKGVSPKVIHQSRIILKRVQQTESFRRSSSRPQTLELANYPSLFGEIRQPETRMLVIPKVSSENRKYIPMMFISPDIIVNGSALIIPEATLYHFGVLTSSVHNDWMRYVCGRMKSDYQYSNTIVYNNFPWPEVKDAERANIEATAQGILDARNKYPDCSFADLYDDTTMPPELRQAHQANDRAVMKAYGFAPSLTESEVVGGLMKQYQRLVEKEETV